MAFFIYYFKLKGEKVIMKTFKKMLTGIAVSMLVVCVAVLPMYVFGDTKTEKQTMVSQTDCSYALICKEDKNTYRTLLVTDSLDKAQRIENNESQYYSDLQIKKFDKNVKELALEDVDDYINSEMAENV